MMYFIATFAFMLIIIALMAVGVIFGRKAIKGSCGGTGQCECSEKCDKRKKRDAEHAMVSERSEHPLNFQLNTKDNN